MCSSMLKQQAMARSSATEGSYPGLQPASISSSKSLYCRCNDSISMLLYQDPSCVLTYKQVPTCHITQHRPFSQPTFLCLSLLCTTCRALWCPLTRADWSLLSAGYALQNRVHWLQTQMHCTPEFTSHDRCPQLLTERPSLPVVPFQDGCNSGAGAESRHARRGPLVLHAPLAQHLRSC